MNIFILPAYFLQSSRLYFKGKMKILNHRILSGRQRGTFDSNFYQALQLNAEEVDIVKKYIWSGFLIFRLMFHTLRLCAWLQILYDTRYSWVGIVSFGVGCAEPGFPGDLLLKRLRNVLILCIFKQHLQYLDTAVVVFIP